MADLKGRCHNAEYCSIASAQKIVTLPADVPFDCPKCGQPMEEIRAAQKTQRNRAMLFVQVIVIIAAGGAVAYKVVNNAGAPAAKSGGMAAGPAPVETASSATVLRPETVAPAQSAASTPAPPADNVAPATMLLRMAGSDIVGAKLARRLASGYLALIGDTDVTTVTAETPGSIAIVGNQAGQHEGIGIAGGNSAAGFAGLLRGSADVAMAVRAPDPDETDKLATLGDLTSATNEHVIAVEGVAAIVSAANRLPSVTMAQLRGIYAGQYTNWSQVGGAAGAIHVFAEDSASGARDTAPAMLLSSAAVRAKMLQNEKEVAAAVAADRMAIGLVALSNAGAARPIAIGDAGATPVLPTELAVSTEDYPLTRRLYLYTAAGSSNNFVRRFTDYVASPAGQAAVEAAGFVPLTLRQTAVALPESTSSRYRDLVANAARVSVDFRFQPGSTDLDSRGVRDLDRLIAFMRAQHADGTRLILAGFADSHGTPAINEMVSQKRADAVASALERAGMKPETVTTFGAELPVADNATPEGRERNRRVEVFLRH